MRLEVKQDARLWRTAFGGLFTEYYAPKDGDF